MAADYGLGRSLNSVSVAGHVDGLSTMKKRGILFAGLSLLALTSCGDDSDKEQNRLERVKAKAAQYGEQAKAKVDVSAAAIKDKIQTLIPAIEQKDLEKLKAVCADLDALLSTKVLGIYYQTFAIEAESGPTDARRFLTEKLEDPALDEHTKRPLRGLNAFFTAKGTVSTKDAALTILAIALEIKFPHGGAVLVTPFMDNPGCAQEEDAPTSQTQPATTNTNGAGK